MILKGEHLLIQRFLEISDMQCTRDGFLLGSICVSLQYNSQNLVCHHWISYSSVNLLFECSVVQQDWALTWLGQLSCEPFILPTPTSKSCYKHWGKLWTICSCRWGFVDGVQVAVMESAEMPKICHPNWPVRMVRRTLSCSDTRPHCCGEWALPGVTGSFFFLTLW